MSNERPIIAVRMHVPVTLGNRAEDFWIASAPSSSQVAGKVTPRPGNPDLGEQRTSIVFEVRMGGPNGDIDVEVPASNLAEVQRKPPEARPAQQPSKK